MHGCQHKYCLLDLCLFARVHKTLQSQAVTGKNFTQCHALL